jgi:hypothetical protein
MTNATLLEVLAIVIFSQQLLAFALKRDGHQKYLLWPLLLPSLVFFYLILWPAVSAGKAMEMNSFLLQVLGYQTIAAVAALFCRNEGQLGQAGFWTAAIFNLGSCVGLIYFSRG